jgi:hypothetical protein
VPQRNQVVIPCKLAHLLERRRQLEVNRDGHSGPRTRR